MSRPRPVIQSNVVSFSFNMAELSCAQGVSSQNDPPAELLFTFSANIEIATVQYSKATSAEARAAALQKIVHLSTKLSTISSPAPIRAMQLMFAPFINTTMRIAVEMDLFSVLPASGEPRMVSELAQKLGAEEDFVFRIARTLASCDIIHETDSVANAPAYCHTSISRFLSTPVMKGMIRHSVDNMLQATCNAVGKFYAERGFRNPEDSKNSPFTFAHGTTDEGIFDIFARMPERAKNLNIAMGVATAMGLEELTECYPFDKLQGNGDGICIVDVGGGRGNMEKMLLDVYPSLTGKLILQDLGAVIESGTDVGEPAVKLQAYDFFQGPQPVQGSPSRRLLRAC